ncbi:hypothetical protein LVQ78_11710 [Buttiauxella sp. A2-C2_NF]|uniref:lipopolysaccharide biosynthesis protein n=1 Tax=Buttiauxella ferragutiae TaxID=82989 RepID=UPI001E4FD9D1|nr:hypothetical protein [Buttiauxella ferragutiae]MCE0826698.1 hypothetical protein [Buttiauxella ferragutiae]
MITKILKKISIDYHIGVTLTYRLWTIVAGAMIIFAIPKFLEPSEQGYYFTFSSVIGLQVFFELGFNYVIVQMLAHEMANVKIIDGGRLTGNNVNINRIYSLVKMLKKWYFMISILFAFAICICGVYFFHVHGDLTTRKWLVPWCLLVLSSAVSLFISPFLSVLEGMGMVGQVAKIRLVQSVIGYTLFFILLSFKSGLYAVPIISASAAIVSCLWVFGKHKNLLFGIKSNGNHVISWRREIFPFQWKIALSWLSGYFMFQLINPILFMHQGSIAAGKVGMTLQVFNTLVTLSMSWINAKTPLMARLIAHKNRLELNSLFRNLFIKSGVVNLCLSFGLYFSIFILNRYSFPVANRFADMDIVGLLVLSSLINHAVFSMSVYMRAHKEEPMLLNSIFVGVGIILCVYFLSKLSVYYALAGYVAIMLMLCLPWCYLLFRKYYKLF